MPQFIQIAVANDGILYALDASGGVWQFSEADDKWYPVSGTRHDG